MKKEWTGAFLRRLLRGGFSAGLALLFIALAACGAPAIDAPKQVQSQPAEATAPPAETEPAEPAPPAAEPSFQNFTSVDLDGNPVTQEIFAEHALTMVNIWGTFCGPCIREMPDLGVLAAEYADRGMQIVGIVADVGGVDDKLADTARRIVAETGADYPHILLSADLWEAKLNTVSAIPTTFFVDAGGNVLSKDYIGSNSADGWRTVIDEVLAGMA